MKTVNKQNNLKDFFATCSEAQVFKTSKALYKFVSMFGEKTLIYWKDSGKISIRKGNNIKGL